MGFWKRKSSAPVEVKKENRVSVISSRNINRLSVMSNRQSIISNSPRVPAWEVIVDQHLSQCLRAAKYRDFTYFRLSAALSSKPDVEQVDYKATLYSTIRDDRPIRRLEALNRSKCEIMGTGFRMYTSEIHGAKDESLSWLDWGRLMDLEEERAMAMIITKIKDTNEEAKLVINNLPPDARDVAAGVWVSGSGVAMGVFRTVCAQISNVSGRVGELERGQFGILRQADQKVSDTVDEGIRAILGPETETANVGEE